MRAGKRSILFHSIFSCLLSATHYLASSVDTSFAQPSTVEQVNFRKWTLCLQKGGLTSSNCLDWKFFVFRIKRGSKPYFFYLCDSVKTNGERWTRLFLILRFLVVNERLFVKKWKSPVNVFSRWVKQSDIFIADTKRRRVAAANARVSSMQENCE